MVSIPVLSSSEIQKAALEGDFLAWQPGAAAPAKIEAEVLLNEREKRLEKRITEVASKLDEKEQTSEAKIQELLKKLEEHQQASKDEYDKFMVQTKKESDQIQGESKYFQLTLEEKKKDVFSDFDQRVEQVKTALDFTAQQSQTVLNNLQDTLLAKEQALTSFVEGQMQAVEAKMQTLQQALAGQQPLSEEKHLQDTSRRTFWLAFWLVTCAVLLMVIGWFSALFPFSASTPVLIQIFASIASLLALLLGGTLFLLWARGVKSSGA